MRSGLAAALLCNLLCLTAGDPRPSSSEATEGGGGAPGLFEGAPGSEASRPPVVGTVRWAMAAHGFKKRKDRAELSDAQALGGTASGVLPLELVNAEEFRVMDKL